MKTSKKTIKQVNVVDAPSLPIPLATTSEINSIFIRTLPKELKSGAGIHHAECFLFIANGLLQNARSFTFNDFVGMSKGMAEVGSLIVADARPLFNHWTEILVQAGRVRFVPKENGCYSEDLFILY